jgi:hypothetical protein
VLPAGQGERGAAAADHHLLQGLAIDLQVQLAGVKLC